jgi:hypothetical protein
MNRCAAGGFEPGEEQQRRYPDEHRLDGEGGAQSDVVGEAAEQVRGGDDQRATEQLGGGVGGVAVSWRGGQGERERERVEVGHAGPAHEEPGDGEDGQAGEPENDESGRRDGQRCAQQHNGPPGMPGEPRSADAAGQDAEVETAHRGGGLSGAQPDGGEQFGAEVDHAELDRDTHGDQAGQQPAGRRQLGPAAGGRPGWRRRQRLVPVAQVKTGEQEHGKAHRQPPARGGALEQAEQKRGEHGTAGRADVGLDQRAFAPFAVPVRQDRLGAGEQRGAGEPEQRGAEQGDGDRVSGEQARAGRGGGRRAPQQPRAGQPPRRRGKGRAGQQRAAGPQRRIHPDHGVGQVQFGPQQGQRGPEGVQPERVGGQRAVAQQRRRIPAEGLAPGLAGRPRPRRRR